MANLLMFADDAVRMTAISYNQPGFQDDNDDLSSYGPDRSYIRTDRRMRKNAFGNDWSQLHRSAYAFLYGTSQVAFSSSLVQRGEVLPTYMSNSVGIASYPAMTAVVSPVARFFLPAAFGTAGVATASALLAVIPAYGLSRAAQKATRYVQDWGYRLRHIEMGGDYQDTATAYALRSRSVAEMSSALSYSRRWLGNESLFMR